MLPIWTSLTSSTICYSTLLNKSNLNRNEGSEVGCRKSVLSISYENVKAYIYPIIVLIFIGRLQCA